MSKSIGDLVQTWAGPDWFLSPGTRRAGLDRRADESTHEPLQPARGCPGVGPVWPRGCGGGTGAQADLQAEDDQLRVEAALALRRVRGKGAAIAALEQLVSTGHDPAAFEACLALAEIGPDARASIPALLAARPARTWMCGALRRRRSGAIGPAALGPIVERLADQSAPLEPAAQASRRPPSWGWRPRRCGAGDPIAPAATPSPPRPTPTRPTILRSTIL